MQAKYPRLKDNFHLRKERTGYLLYRGSQDPDSIICSYISNQECGFLGLMSGAESHDSIVAMIKDADKNKQSETEELYSKVLQKYKDYIQLLDYPSEKSRLSPILEFVSSESSRLNQPSCFYNNRLSAPVRLCMMVSALCNCSCRYCCNKSVIGDPRTVPIDVYVRFLQEAKQSGCINIVFTGGEPTLYPQLPELIQTCTDLGLKAEVVSRAQSNMDLWEVLLNNGLKYVEISLDSMDEEVVDSMSGPGVFKKTMAVISLLVDKKIDLGVNAIMTRQSVDGVARLVDGLLDMGVTKLALRHFMPPVGQSNTDDLQVTQNQKDKFNKFVSSKFSEWGDTVLPFLYNHELSHRIVQSNKKKEHDLPKAGCSSGASNMLIANDGSAIYCDRVISLPNMIYGNIQNSSLLELWHSKELIHLRYPSQSKHKNSLCGNCPDYTLCLKKGKCYYYSYFNYSVPYAPDFLCNRIPNSEHIKGVV